MDQFFSASLIEWWAATTRAQALRPAILGALSPHLIGLGAFLGGRDRQRGGNGILYACNHVDSSQKTTLMRSMTPALLAASETPALHAQQTKPQTEHFVHSKRIETSQEFSDAAQLHGLHKRVVAFLRFSASSSQTLNTNKSAGRLHASASPIHPSEVERYATQICRWPGRPPQNSVHGNLPLRPTWP